MKIEVKRFEYGTNYTVGRMFVDESYICFTLEDRVREIPGTPVEDWKIPGETAIPTGAYKVVMSFSNHFQKDLPELLNVPGYSGVRIHTGNSDKDTEGCILVGSGWAGTDWISGSKDAFEHLMNELKYAFDRKEDVVLEIR